MKAHSLLFNPAKKEFIRPDNLDDIPKYEKLFRGLFEPWQDSALPETWAGDELVLIRNDENSERIQHLLTTYRNITKHALDKGQKIAGATYTKITKDGMKSYTVEDDDSFVPCANCKKVFSTELEGSTDKPELCDQCWSEVSL